MKAIAEEAEPVPLVTRSKIEVMPGQRANILDLTMPALTFGSGVGLFILGMLMIPSMKLQAWVMPSLLGIIVLLQLLFLDVYRQYKVFDWRIAALALLAFILLYIYRLLPEYFAFGQINAIIHRSLFAALSFLLISPPAMSLGLFYVNRARLSAQDVAVYPLLLTPVVLTLGLYLVMIFKIVQLGQASFDWEVLTHPFALHGEFFRTFIAGDWPIWDIKVIQQAGMLNHLMGTGMLILMTSMISLPIGIGTGVYLSEYGDTRFGAAARFSITSLRAISLLILAFFAYSLVDIGKETVLAPFLSGTYTKLGAEQLSSGGSYLVASLVLSLVIIPVIARATEEGCRSTPGELREGSLALGASEERTIRKVILPWAMPNIVTSWLLGCAETAGAVAVLMFIAGTGEYGVGPFRQVTSLAYYIFNAYHYTDLARAGLMKPYVYMAALLLLSITLGFGIAALLIKRWLIHRFRGG
jgi:phosphate transport system permease protein